ncbi:hypothetical protein NP511_07105 [Natrinema thermotolerans]|uniref:Uncharacterized protein n=1 Tax=Natrinema thermotolerans TaxID=121872 RepID=A0AAF0PC66_9EURY|nr:hypothetical protein [Natrinema thermotolerans]WMT09398.1 hypothetical protein NP511_07105 [Natrinema thermotolerans]
MASSTGIILLSIYLIQFLIAIFVYVDMCRFDLDEFQRYDLAILIPLGGLLLFPYYIFKRNGFEKSKSTQVSYARIKSILVSTRAKLFALTLITGVPFKAAGSQAPGSKSQLVLLVISGIGAFLLFRILRQYHTA